MKRVLLVVLFLVCGFLLCRYAYCEDNLLALDTSYSKKTAVVADKNVQKDEAIDKVIKPLDQIPPDDSDKELEKMRSYRELIQGRQKEVDLIKLGFIIMPLYPPLRQAIQEFPFIQLC